MKIECSECVMYRTEHCDDCLVTALLHPGDEVVEIDEGMDRPIETLASAGLIPVLRFRPRDESSRDEPSDRPGADPPGEGLAGTG